MLNQPRSARAFAPGTIECYRTTWVRRTTKRLLRRVLGCIVVLVAALLPFLAAALMALLLKGGA
jgi:hypothetical protein